MPKPQLELWSAEPHPTPPVYPQLTPQQQSRLVRYLAQLILRLVPGLPTNPPSSDESKSHER
jgi:hypothetical protein